MKVILLLILMVFILLIFSTTVSAVATVKVLKTCYGDPCPGTQLGVTHICHLKPYVQPIEAGKTK